MEGIGRSAQPAWERRGRRDGPAGREAQIWAGARSTRRSSAPCRALANTISVCRNLSQQTARLSSQHNPNPPAAANSSFFLKMMLQINMETVVWTHVIKNLIKGNGQTDVTENLPPLSSPMCFCCSMRFCCSIRSYQPLATESGCNPVLRCDQPLATESGCNPVLQSLTLLLSQPSHSSPLLLSSPVNPNRKKTSRK
jgi:hypothetical protein